LSVIFNYLYTVFSFNSGKVSPDRCFTDYDRSPEFNIFVAKPLIQLTTVFNNLGEVHCNSWLCSGVPFVTVFKEKTILLFIGTFAAIY